MAPGSGNQAGGAGRRRTTLIVHCGTAVLASAYPLSIVIGVNVGLVPVDAVVLVRAFAIGIGLVALALPALTLLFPSLELAARWLTVFLLLTGAYGFTVRFLQVHNGTFAATYAILGVVVSTLVVRPWRKSERDPVSLMIVVLLLLGANLAPAIGRLSNFDADHWQEYARSLIPPITPVTDSVVKPDVFYVVLDGFGREDILRTHYEADLRPFVEYLTSSGFYIPARARSNYAQTFLSLSSFLNLTLLDDVRTAVNPSEPGRLALNELIQHNALFTIASEAGYQSVAIASDYMATQKIATADVCICNQRGLDEIDRAIIGLTPLSGLPLAHWTYGSHRKTVLDAFDALQTSRASDKPLFVFAHIVAPHPPFVFDEDGSPRQPARPFGFHDGNDYRGTKQEYIDGYRAQVQFVAKRMTTVLQSLLARPGPPPVMVIHGDHGPGSRLDWRNADNTDMAERMAVFAAYRFPGFEGDVYPTMTVVNGARLLANYYFGTAVPPIEDASWFSPWLRPYDLIRVDDGMHEQP